MPVIFMSPVLPALRKPRWQETTANGTAERENTSPSITSAR
jgi:hypothetical protein